MNPILYPRNTTDFSRMGIGVLSDTISCTVTQDAGCYELEMEYPIGGVHFDAIRHSCWLKVVCPPRMEDSPQLFYIVHITKPLNKVVTIVAHHVSYKLNFIPVKPFSAYTVSDVFNQIKIKSTEENNFTFQSDRGIVPVRMTRQYPVMAMSLLGGEEGSLLDLIGGEFYWDNYTVTFVEESDEDWGRELRYGVNITDLKQEENISETITGVVPYWFNEGDDNGPVTLVMLPETTLYSQNADAFPFKRSITVDFSSEIEATYDANHKLVPPTVAQLREACQDYIEKAGIGVPKVSIDVSIENLARSDEYASLKNLQQVNLYDIVTVIFPILGIEKKAKIIKTVYDVLQQKYISLSIGEKQASLSDRLTGALSDKTEKVEDEIKNLDGKTEGIKNKTEDLEDKTEYLEGQKDALWIETENLTEKIDNDIAATKQYADNQLLALDTTLRAQIKADVKAGSEAIMGGKGGYVVMHQTNVTDPPHVDEILIMDTNKESTAQKIIRLNKNGIGFSNNGGVSYDSTWTIDGAFVANKLAAQTVTSMTINTGYINAGNIKAVNLQAVTIGANGNTPSYIRAATLETGNALRFNYSIAVDGETIAGTVTAATGSANTHLTANTTQTWRGLTFQGSVPGSGETDFEWASDTYKRGHAIIMDSYNFVVSSRKFVISAQHGYGSRGAGMQVEQTTNDNIRLILNTRTPSNYSRLTLLGGTIDVIYNSWGVLLNAFCKVEDVLIKRPGESEYYGDAYIPCSTSSWGYR